MPNKVTRKGLSVGIIGLLFLTSILSTACGPSGYVEPITKFQSSASIVIASTRLYVSELNKVERDHYINQKVTEKKDIDLAELEGVQVFSQDGLRARLDALDQLAKYGELLSKLAKSNAPERVQAEAKDLGDSISHLEKTLAGTPNSQFKESVGAVSSIVGEIVSLIVERKIEKALDTAIEKGEQPINRLIAVIRNDISLAYERKRTSLSELRVAFRDDYARELAKGDKADPEKLRMLAGRISAHEDRWEVFASANPSEGLDAMAKAHSALVQYAKSAHKVKDFESLVAAMEAFSARAISLGKSVQTLRAQV